MDDRRAKVDAYLNMIMEHVVQPINRTDLKESCTATILLIFAAIDGLGKLTHPRCDAQPGKRFRHYLSCYMGGEYTRRQDALYKLRCSLAHNALNFSSFISKTEMGEPHHLKYDTALGFLFVSSTVLFRDFCASLSRLREAFDRDPALLSIAAERLEWREDDIYAYWGLSTPPPPAVFVSMK